jgi:DHA1 family bicyclomycin/chloramphenicol resistance-like MFS transporter
MLLNARIVGMLGAHRTARLAIAGYTAVALGLLAVALLTDGKPSFWVAVIGLGGVLVMHATMIPNVNAVALEPLGHVAGTASAVIGTMSLAGGALLGALIDRSISGTITPLVLGMVAYGLIAAGWITWADAGTSPPAPGEKTRPLPAK